jgi:hypothetical protein
MARIRRNLEFEAAREIARAERIESVSQYIKWHDLNKPAGLPKRPDRAYHKDFISWNDFLGNDTPFPVIRRTWRSFNESRAFSQSLGISIKQEWLDFCDDGGKPDDIPRRPDLYYRKRDEWISWPNFLGATLTSKEETVIETQSIFFIIHNPKADKGFFRCGVTNGGPSSVNDFLRKINGKLIVAYYVPQTFRLDTFLSQFDVEEDREYAGYYYIPKLVIILSELSIQFNHVYEKFSRTP